MRDQQRRGDADTKLSAESVGPLLESSAQSHLCCTFANQTFCNNVLRSLRCPRVVQQTMGDASAATPHKLSWQRRPTNIIRSGWVAKIFTARVRDHTNPNTTAAA